MYDFSRELDRCKELIKPENSNWLGISNQKAIAYLIDICQDAEKQLNQFYNGELYTAKQLRNIDEGKKTYYIHKDKIKTILGAETNDEESLLSLLETIIDENNRLEDIEDKKVQIEYNNVFNKGVESVKDKIREKIKELEDIKKEKDLIVTELEIQIEVLNELMEKLK